MDAIVEYLKSIPKDLLLSIVYQLMVDGKLSYHELMDLHVQNMERMRSGETDAYFRFQAKVVNMWADNKSVLYDGYVNIHSLTKYGQTSISSYNKCVIFPLGKTTWEGFVSPCNFKDGDILYAIDEGKEFIFILKNIGEHGEVYCYLNLKGDDLRIQEVWLTDYNATHRLATEEEKQKLFQAIKENGYRWNTETKTLEKLDEPKFKVGDKIQHKNQHEVCLVSEVCDNHYLLDEKDIALPFFAQDDWELAPDKFDIATLNPFSEVLVRYDNDNPWMTAHFSHYMKDVEWEYPYFASGACFRQCIPYKGNEHLRGTTNDCDDFYKTWER